MPNQARWLALALQIVGSVALSTAPLHLGLRRSPPLHGLRRQPYAIACMPDELDRSSVVTPAPPEEGPRGSPTLTAVLALNVVTLLWGSQHAVIKGLVDITGSPDVVNAARFDLAALLALPWVPRLRPDDPEADQSARATWATGVDLGLWMFAGFSLQAVGLQLTSASRSAFLLYLNVKLVPIIAFFVYGRAVAGRTWASAGAAGLERSPPSPGGGAPVAHPASLRAHGALITQPGAPPRPPRRTRTCRAVRLERALKVGTRSHFRPAGCDRRRGYRTAHLRRQPAQRG